MIRLPTILLLLLVMSSASADFQSAAKSYRARNYPDAYRQFIVLARGGDARAQTVIAMMHKYGESVPQDPKQAFSWYLKAAQQGYGPAMYNVGIMYAAGNGVAADQTAAIQWLKKAAKAGFSRANDKLAQLGADKITNTKPIDESEPWPKSWNLRLPNSVRDDKDSDTVPPPDATWLVQVGSMNTRAGANRLWDALTDHAPALFRNVDAIIRLADDTPQRVYRVQTGPFDTLKAARQFCHDLQNQVSIGCMPVRQ